MKSYRDLIVWQKSVDMVTHVYRLLKLFPEDEKYGLTSQIKRSAVLEGYGRNYTKEYVRFLNISRGLLYEMQTQLQIAINLEFLKSNDLIDVNDLSLQIEKMLNSLIKKLAV